MKLHNLKPAKGSRSTPKRVGRGMGSGLGKTAGRGEKGQKSRRGFSRKRGFEGGQMPLHRRLPKRGFTNIFRRPRAAVNVSRLAGLAGETEVTPEFLKENGFVPGNTELVKILGQGDLSVKLTVKAHRFSQTAAAKIEAAGGKVERLPLPVRGPKPGTRSSRKSTPVQEKDGEPA